MWRDRFFLAALSMGFIGTLCACGDIPTAASLTPVNDNVNRESETGLTACMSTEPDPPVLRAGDKVTLDASCTSASTGTGVTAFNWDLGDGRAEQGVKVRAQYKWPGDYVVTLTVQDDGGNQASTSRKVIVKERPRACFKGEQVPFSARDGQLPCTYKFDASCSGGDIAEYRWFFQGHPYDVGLSDVAVTTREPTVIYSWAKDESCMSFRPFKRVVQLTVVDREGNQDTTDQEVDFSYPQRGR